MSFDQNENSRMHRERRRAEGRCLYCGKPLDHEGRVACTKCTRKKVAAQKSVRLERQANGLCVVCGKTRASVFMKDSLIPIVREENMRREFPW